MKPPPTTEHVARRRIAASQAPAAFRRQLLDTGALLEDGGVLSGVWTAADPVRVAAEIEAAAGHRRWTALSHHRSCECDACRVRAHLPTDIGRTHR